MSEVSAVTQFFAALDARIARYDLLQHPFYQAWSKGELTRDELREYASEYWHHVSAFPTYLSALHARLEDAPLRRTVLIESTPIALQRLQHRAQGLENLVDMLGLDDERR